MPPASEIIQRIAPLSLHPRARLTGIIYLLYFLTAVSAGILVRGIVVSGDAVATAYNILAHETLYRLGYAIGLIGTALYIVLAVLFYDMFKPVNKSLSLLAAFVSLVGGVVQAVGSFFRLAPLVVLGGSPYLNVFKVDQLQALALLFLKLHAQSSNIELVFFGFYDLLIGYLIFRSAFLPRILGLVMAVAGLGWLLVLSPPLATSLSTCIKVLGFLSELSLMLWLLIIGVNVQRWKEQAGL